MKIIRLSESDLHRIIKNSVSRIIKEDVANHVKDTGLYRLSDDELINAYNLEKKLLSHDSDVTDEFVYKYAFTPSEKKKYDNSLRGQQDKMIEKRITKTATNRLKKYEIAMKERGLIHVDKSKESNTDNNIVPNKNAVANSFEYSSARKVKKTHTEEEIQIAKPLIDELYQKAKDLFYKYGSYDVANRFKELFTNINLALYEYTGTEYDDVPTVADELDNHPTPQEAEKDLTDFRVNVVFPIYRKLKNIHIKNCLVNCSFATKEITKVLSGEDANEEELRKLRMRKAIQARNAAYKVDRERLRINGVENDLL